MISDVQVDPRPDGYEIRIAFILPIQYQSHAPHAPSKFLRVRLRPLDFRSLNQDEVDHLKERVLLAWDATTGVPLQHIAYNGRDPAQPEITFRFTRNVGRDVRGSADLRSLIVTVLHTPRPEAGAPRQEGRAAGEFAAAVPGDSELATRMEAAMAAAQEAATKDTAVPGDSELATRMEAAMAAAKEAATKDTATPGDRKMAELMAVAHEAVTNEAYSQAAELYTQVVNIAEGKVKRQAQELLGLVYDRSGQPHRARVEYEKYLQQVPKGPDAERVRQRLAGLVTATMEPKTPLTTTQETPAPAHQPTWESRYFGGVSEVYAWDQTNAKLGGTRVHRSDFTTDLNLDATWRSSAYDLRAQVVGGHRQALLSRELDEDRISALSFEMRDKTHRWSSKIGRQSRTSGGVLGRYDGLHAAYGLTPSLTLNGVFGFPVESTRDTAMNTDRTVYGVSTDFGPYAERWELSTFFANQENSGLTDRRAIGQEIRYFDRNKALFNLIDYDVFFGVLNSVVLSGYWTLPMGTTLNLGLDYRRSPTLTTNNAIQGQQVNKLSDLFGRFSDDELRSFAKTLTPISKSMTFDVTQEFSKDVQVVGEVMMSELEGTDAAGGVAAIPGTGKEFFYSAQLIASNFLLENDVATAGLHFAKTATHDGFGFTLDSHLPFTRKLLMVPEFQFDYRNARGSGSDRITRVTMSPRLRVDYLLQKWMHFELEGGMEWRDQSSLGPNEDSQEAFLSAGYRLNF